MKDLIRSEHYIKCEFCDKIARKRTTINGKEVDLCTKHWLDFAMKRSKTPLFAYITYSRASTEIKDIKELPFYVNESDFLAIVIPYAGNINEPEEKNDFFSHSLERNWACDGTIIHHDSESEKPNRFLRISEVYHTVKLSKK